jgi:hypothetical protein
MSYDKKKLLKELQLAPQVPSLNRWGSLPKGWSLATVTRRFGISAWANPARTVVPLKGKIW